MSDLLIAWAAAQWAYWLRWAQTHCWACDAEAGDYRDGDTCPHCGRDLVPF